MPARIGRQRRCENPSQGGGSSHRARPTARAEKHAEADLHEPERPPGHYLAIWFGIVLATSTLIGVYVASAEWMPRTIGLLAAGPFGLIADMVRRGSVTSEHLVVLSITTVLVAGPTGFALLLRNRWLGYYGAVHWPVLTWGIFEALSV